MKGESLFQPTSVKDPPLSSVIFPARNLIYRGFPGVSHSHLLICKGFPARHVWWHRRGPVLNHGDSARPNWLKPNWRLPSMGQSRRGGRRLVSSETRWLICPLVKRKRWRAGSYSYSLATGNQLELPYDRPKHIIVLKQVWVLHGFTIKNYDFDHRTTRTYTWSEANVDWHKLYCNLVSI
jgi:hypothetical protein